MSWAFFLDSHGRPQTDLYAFARLGRVVSEHPTKPEADAARDAYVKRQATEALRAAGQREIPW